MELEGGTMITLDEVVDLIHEQARGKLPKDVPIERTTRLEDLGLSSLQVSEIVFTLEERHDVEFDDSRAADIATLDQVLAVANDAIAARCGTAAPELDREAV